MEFDQVIDKVSSRREAIRILSGKYGLSNRSIYKILEEEKLD